MPTHPYRRLGPIDSYEIGQTLVHHTWPEHYDTFYRIREVLSNGHFRVERNDECTSSYSPTQFGQAASWILIEDDVPYKKARRPKSGFGLFVKAQEEKDALCPV